MLKYIAVCCCVLWCVAVRGWGLFGRNLLLSSVSGKVCGECVVQCVAVCCSVLQCLTVSCSVMHLVQCDAVRCTVLQCDAV